MPSPVLTVLVHKVGGHWLLTTVSAKWENPANPVQRHANSGGGNETNRAIGCAYSPSYADDVTDWSVRRPYAFLSMHGTRTGMRLKGLYSREDQEEARSWAQALPTAFLLHISKCLPAILGKPRFKSVVPQTDRLATHGLRQQQHEGRRMQR